MINLAHHFYSISKLHMLSSINLFYQLFSLIYCIIGSLIKINKWLTTRTSSWNPSNLEGLLSLLNLDPISRKMILIKLTQFNKIMQGKICIILRTCMRSGKKQLRVMGLKRQKEIPYKN